MPHRGRRRGGTQTPRAAPGQTFGERKEQVEAQQSVPLPDRQAQVQQVAQRAAEFGQQAQASPLRGPTQRPREPITDGLTRRRRPTPSPAPRDPNEPALRRLAQFLPVLEARAEQPDASHALNAFVLQLRSAIPQGPDDIEQLMGRPDGLT